MAVLYSKISPTIFGYEASVEASNQQFVMITVANSAIDLASSSQGSQTRVKIISQNAVYSLSNGYTLDLTLDNGGLVASHSTQLGSFNGNITSSYHQDRGTFYYGRVSSESSLVTMNTTEATNFVSKGVFSDTEIDFSLYFKTRMEITQRVNGDYDITFIIIKLVQLQNNYDFPINLEEWTLRLVRQTTVITEAPTFVAGAGLTLQQSISGTSLNPIDLSALSGHNVNVKFIEVPIQFGL